MPAINIPETFICPITGDLPQEPARLIGDTSPYVFELSKLIEAIRKTHKHPVTKVFFTEDKITLCHDTKQKINNFLSENEILTTQEFVNAVTNNKIEVIEARNYFQSYLEVNEDQIGALHVAAARGYKRMVELLLRDGAEVDQIGPDRSTPLHLAATNGHKDIVELLIKKGAKIEAVCEPEGRTALLIAASLGHTETVEVLLTYGADAKALTNKKRHALSLSHEAALSGSVELVTMLLKQGVFDVNQTTTTQATPLFLAIVKRAHGVVRLLLESGSNLAVVLQNNQTLLHIATERDKGTELVKILLEFGINIHAEDKFGNTPLHIAARKDSAGLVKLLLEKQARVNSVNLEGKTPLHVAAENNATNVALPLLERGANFQALDNENLTPTGIAEKYNHTEILSEFCKYGMSCWEKLQPTPTQGDSEDKIADIFVATFAGPNHSYSKLTTFNINERQKASGDIKISSLLSSVFLGKRKHTDMSQTQNPDRELTIKPK